MIRKLLSISLLIISLAYTSQIFAFGDIFKGIADAVIQGVVGPQDFNFPSPPLKDRLTNIADPSSIKFGSNDKTITGTQNHKLAIIKSINVDEQINAYQKYVDWNLKLIKSYALNPAPIIAEANTFITGNQYYENVVAILKPRFSSTVEAKDLKEAFEQGADYVAIVDIKIEFKPLGTETGPLSVSNTADVSILFIDKSLEAAPNIVIQNTVINNYEGTNPDENFKKELGFIKVVRDKTLSEFKSQLYNVIISETDDPPALGVRLNLSSDITEDKPKLNNKNKNKK